VVEDHDVDVVWRSADGSVSEVLPVERSSEQSGEQVTNRLQVLTASGVKTANDGAEAIGVVELISTKAPGADDIDLTGATMQWVDDSATYDLVHHAAFDEANHDGAFGVAPIKDADGSLRDADRINDPDDRVRLVVDLGEFDDASQDEFTDAVTAAVPIRESGLGEGATAQMRITTASGAATTMRLTVPESLADREAVSL
jgi:flagellin FlaB